MNVTPSFAIFCRGGEADVREVQAGPEDEFRDEVILGDGLRTAQYAGGNLRSRLRGRLQRNLPLQRHPLFGNWNSAYSSTLISLND